MASRVFSQHLDRDKPLWELWMVEGLEGGRWALLSKVHHCMVDGVAATDLMSVMFSDTTAALRRRASGRRRPSPPASSCSCARSRDRASPDGQLQTLRRALSAPRRDAALARGDRRVRRLRPVAEHASGRLPPR